MTTFLYDGQRYDEPTLATMNRSELHELSNSIRSTVGMTKHAAVGKNKITALQRVAEAAAKLPKEPGGAPADETTVPSQAGGGELTTFEPKEKAAPAPAAPKGKAKRETWGHRTVGKADCQKRIERRGGGQLDPVIDGVLELLEGVGGGNPLSCPELADKLGVEQKIVRNAVDRARRYGYPIISAGRGVGWYLDGAAAGTEAAE